MEELYRDIGAKRRIALNIVPDQLVASLLVAPYVGKYRIYTPISVQIANLLHIPNSLFRSSCSLQSIESIDDLVFAAVQKISNMPLDKPALEHHKMWLVGDSIINQQGTPPVICALKNIPGISLIGLDGGLALSSRIEMPENFTKMQVRGGGKRSDELRRRY